MDETAFLLEYAGLIRFVARKFKPSTALDREDLLQLGRMGALHALADYDPNRNYALRSWVYMGVRRAIVEAYRKAHHIHQRTRDQEGKATGYGQDVRFSPIESARGISSGGLTTAGMDVARLLDMCGPRDRAVLEARFLRDLTLRELAVEFGVTYQSAWWLVRDAIGRVKRLVRR